MPENTSNVDPAKRPAENADDPKLKRIDFEHKAMAQTKENGRNDYLPNNVEIRSPYDTDGNANFKGVDV